MAAIHFPARDDPACRNRAASSTPSAAIQIPAEAHDPGPRRDDPPSDTRRPANAAAISKARHRAGRVENLEILENQEGDLRVRRVNTVVLAGKRGTWSFPPGQSAMPFVKQEAPMAAVPHIVVVRVSSAADAARF